MFTAMYLPKLKMGQEDPNKDGFVTASDAWDYIKSQMCEYCKSDLQREPKIKPDCMYEWFVVNEDIK